MDTVDKAIEVFNEGGIVIFPTDTAFGIGCRIDRPASIRKLFEIRKRPTTQAAPVLVCSIEMAEQYFAPLAQDVTLLMRTQWPGGLTIIYTAKDPDSVSNLVRGGTNTLGLRMPDHDTTLDIIKQVGVPILGPSANFHGEPTPYELEDLNRELIKLVDYVMPGECKTKKASTVIDCTQTPFKIVRQGAVTLSLS